MRVVVGRPQGYAVTTAMRDIVRGRVNARGRFPVTVEMRDGPEAWRLPSSIKQAAARPHGRECLSMFLDDEYNTRFLCREGNSQRQWPGAGGTAANRPPVAGGVTLSTPPPKVGLCLTL